MSTDKERIFIKRIDISNVGRFYGQHSITLSDSPDKNITIILGLSGRGKSTIHNLIYWGLYGEHKNSNEREEIDYGLINIDALQNLSKYESTTASVTLDLYNNQGIKYSLTRELIATYDRDSTTQKFEPQNNSRVSAGLSFVTTVKLVYKDESGDLNTEKNDTMIKNEINKYFPKHLSDFFLFDGENLIKFQNNTSSDFIKDGITKISGLGILNNLAVSALETECAIDKHIGGKSATAAPYVKDVERLEGQINVLNEDVKYYKGQSDNAKKLYDKISDKIRQNKTGKDLEERRNIAKANRDKTSNRNRKNDEDIKDMLFEKIPQLLLRSTLQNSEKIFAKLEEEDKIPPSISRGALDKILDSSPLRCICGREFEKSDDSDSPWKTLNQIKATIIEDGLSQGISLGRDLISRIIDVSSIEKSRNDYNDLENIRRETNNDIHQYQTEMNQLDNEIRDVKYDDNQDLGSKREKYWESIRLNQAKETEKRFELENLEDKLTEAKTKRDIAIEKEGTHENEINKKSLAKAVRVFTKKLERRIEEILRSETQKETSKYFLESAPESQTFDHVNISENYDIAVRDSSGLNSDLSKGQAHVLGLSYVAGIRKITHTDTFLIIDSPLHNISGKARNQISDVFSQYLPSVQIVLLVTDTEYTHGDDKGAEPVKNILRKSNRVWKEYSIEEVQTEDGIASRKIVEYEK